MMGSRFAFEVRVYVLLVNGTKALNPDEGMTRKVPEVYNTVNSKFELGCCRIRILLPQKVPMAWRHT